MTRVVWALLFCLAFAGVAVAAPRSTTSVTVEVTEGQLRGEALRGGGFSFKGVPFAKPPVGERRWMPPEPPEPWQGVREADASAPACAQADYGWNRDLARGSSEDCLYLELRTPGLDPSAKRPVMVFIHGGANRAGGAMGTISSDIASRDVVMVSIAYRLGALGFLSHPALTAQSANKASGNYALMDQVRALEWVRDNIGRFGGDPNNVTIFGHSAGAQDVGLLMVSPLGRRLFHRVILQSGNPQFGYFTRSLKENETLGVELARKLIIDQSIDASGVAGLNVLKAASLQALQKMADTLDAPIDDDGFIWDQAVVDGYVIREAPENTFQAGRQARVPMIIGVTASELDLHGGAAAQYQALQAEYPNQYMKMLRVYGIDLNGNPPPDPVLGSPTRQILTDRMFRCPALWLAKAHAQSRQPVWFYHLGVFKPSASNTLNLAIHGSELPFVFEASPTGSFSGDWPPLGGYWLSFARTGNPNAPKLKEWGNFAGQGRYADFTPNGMIMNSDLRAQVCPYRPYKGG